MPAFADISGVFGSTDAPLIASSRMNAMQSSHRTMHLDCFVAVADDQFVAKQYNSPSPPVERRSAWLQPPSLPREGCEKFHEWDAASSRRPLRSMCPSMTAPCVLL